MYIAAVPNRNSPPAFLLREGYRENGKVKTRTLANLTSLPPRVIEDLRRSLKGEKLASVEESFEIIPDGSPAHGHVEAVMTAMRRLGFSRLISSRSSHQRNLVIAMVVARILEPKSKLATTRWWSDTTLPETLNISGANEDHLYDAMDWALKRQHQIEKKLAGQHLKKNGQVLYDLTSSYFEGVTCPLAARGHDRDGKKGKLQVNYGLLTNQFGIPVAVSVFEGNTADPKTLIPQVNKVKDDFGIKQFVMVGDRGMLTQKQIDTLSEKNGIDWIGALRPEAIKKLVNCGMVQMGLFDKHNLFELKHPDFPDERLVACFNAELAQRRSIKREKLLQLTVKELDIIRRMVWRGRLRGKKEIETKVFNVLKKYKIRKYYKLDVREDEFKYKVNGALLVSEIESSGKRNPELIKKRLERSKRHIASINKQLDAICHHIENGRLHGKDKIGVRIGKVVNKYKVGWHFKLCISDNDFTFEINRDKVWAEAELDGIYVIRTGISENRLDAAEAVRGYKQLSMVERAFRSFKTVDLMVRPIHHRLEDRVRAHIFLCMLAYYVQWHMMEAWRPLIYADEDQRAKKIRDPISPAKRSDSALQKIHNKKLEDGSEVHSFRSLLGHLGAIVRATCRVIGEGEEVPTFTMVTKYNEKQQKAFEMLHTIHA